MIPPRRLLALLLLLAFPARASLVVGRVLVRGAVRTRTEAAEARMRLQPGDPVTFESLAAGEERLLASGLYTSAHVSVDMPPGHAARLMYLDPHTYTIDVLVDLREKIAWFVYPYASVGGGPASGGVFFGHQNLGGLLLQTYAAAQLGQTTSYVSVGLRDPILRIAPLTYVVDATVRSEDYQFYESHRVAQIVPITVGGGEALGGYNFSSDTRLMIGAGYHRLSVGAPTQLPQSGAPLAYNDQGGNVVALQLQLVYDHTTAPEGLRRGRAVYLKNEVSDAFWKSDFDYAKLKFRLELDGYLLRTYPSLTLLGVFAYPTSKHGVPITELWRAGGPDLRGYRTNEFRGDTVVTLQLEEQAPLYHLRRPWHLVFAGAAFADAGTLLERHPGGRITTAAAGMPEAEARPKLHDIHSSVGGGLRVLVPGVAIPAVKVDVAYGIDVRDWAVTLSIAGGSEF